LSTTCTEEEFWPNLTGDMVHGGFLPRWLLVHSESPPWRRRESLPDNISFLENTFRNIIFNLYNYFR